MFLQRWGKFSGQLHGGLIIRTEPKADPPEEENIIGFCNSLLKGTAAVSGGQFEIVGKSPALETCSDSNVGGTAGPKIKGKHNCGRTIY